MEISCFQLFVSSSVFFVSIYVMSINYNSVLFFSCYLYTFTYCCFFLLFSPFLYCCCYVFYCICTDEMPNKSNQIKSKSKVISRHSPS